MKNKEWQWWQWLRLLILGMLHFLPALFQSGISFSFNRVKFSRSWWNAARWWKAHLWERFPVAVPDESHVYVETRRPTWLGDCTWPSTNPIKIWVSTKVKQTKHHVMIEGLVRHSQYKELYNFTLILEEIIFIAILCRATKIKRKRKKEEKRNGAVSYQISTD